jgi:CheY-like chemotaxis protein
MNKQNRRRILIVDNDEDMLFRLGKELTEAGYEVTTTWSGVEALSLLESCAFDSLLVDDYLPDLYIGEFLQKLSPLSVCPRIYVMHLDDPPALQADSSPVFTCVDKGRVSKILQALAEEESGVGRKSWTH